MQRRKQPLERSIAGVTGVLNWHPARGVLWCTQGNLVVLLSLETGHYYTLNEIGARVWACLCESRPVDHISALIAAEYDAPHLLPVISGDVDVLLTDLWKHRLIEPVARPSNPRVDIGRQQLAKEARGHPPRHFEVDRKAIPPSRVPSRLFCLASLVIIHWSLKAFGLRRVLVHIYRLGVGSGFNVSDDWLKETSLRVVLARAWYPFSTQCLHQSLCLLWLVRRAGADAKLRVGVLAYPFQAHAWVEHRGKPLNESDEQLRLYSPFPSLEPGDC